MSLDAFHPAVSEWFRERFGVPTPVQDGAWKALSAGQPALLAAPTGSGKTLAAFLAAIDELVRDGAADALPDETRVLYVSPLKALSNDIRRNLEEPLAGIRARLDVFSDTDIRTAVRTGDTPQAERAKMRRLPPHILVTTPESLYILLTSASGREMLSTVRTVIVDELHAVADTKRGAHLMLSLERLAALCPRPPVRVGISATQKPIERMAEFLLGAAHAQGCEIVDAGHVRERDLAVEVPGSPLQPVMATEVWAEIYDRLAALAEEHRSTLVFVNTRRLAERAARHLAERLGEAAVMAHHGSLAREQRLTAESRLKAGELKVLVATASLELGIDIGDVDLVCQLGSPRGIATLLQRVGRSGHGVDRVPKGRLFPLSRDDLVECTALLDAVRRDELDALDLAGPALDVLAQQVVAEVAMREWPADELYALCRRAWPYRTLEREVFDAVIGTLAEGYATARGRRSAHVHYDAVNGLLRPRPGSRLTAITNGGTIPDQFDYDVVLLPEGFSIGNLNEDFAFESLPGDIFQLGNLSYRVLKVDTGKVFVEDAKGQPPTIPFWFGEAPGRTDELSEAVSRLRAGVEADLERAGAEAARRRLAEELHLPDAAALQLVEYLATAKAALGALPTHDRLILERFFDEVGDTHLVIHSPHGSRVNRAFGLALRKRFCRKFNFELQAAALEDSLVLSLGPTHSFPLAEVAGYLRVGTVRDVLTQALLAAPMFPTRWRWVATTALAIRRNRNGRKVPPQFQRSDADDLLAVVFPDQVACAENLAGDREVPDHPLVHQTLHDCLHELMDIAGLERLLGRIAAGEVEVIARELTTPSPLAQEIINARPYAFLDDAPAEERRTRAVASRHLLDPEEAANLGRLDPAAIEAVRAEAWPEARNADELQDALSLAGFVTAEEAARSGPADWPSLLPELVASRRATVLRLADGRSLWAAAERLGQLRRLLPDAREEPPIEAVERPGRRGEDTHETAAREILRSRLESLGPVTVAALAASAGLAGATVQQALVALEVEGQAVRGHYSPEAANGGPGEWCDRRLLARIHRYTLKSLRRAVEPVSPAAYMRFLFRWHGLGTAADRERGEGPEALRLALRRLAGFPAPAAAWEGALLPLRVADYSPFYMDQVLGTGEYGWLRAPAEPAAERRRQGPIRTTPILFVDRETLPAWQVLFGAEPPADAALSGPARRVREALARGGAMFFADLVRATGLLRTQAEEALGELAAWGLVSADGFAGLRALITPASRRASFSRPLSRRGLSVDAGGRWALAGEVAVLGDRTPGGETSEEVSGERGGKPDADEARAGIVRMAEALLDRYGVVFRALLPREARFLPPWRELVRVYRRLEARGELRGGRFVAGFSGEQFARPEAVDLLRKVREPGTGHDLVVSAADPCNLAGLVTPGERIPAVAGNRVLYRDGVPVAVFVGREFRWLGGSPDPAAEFAAREALTRSDPRYNYVASAASLRAV